jgi:hypothetical protein
LASDLIGTGGCHTGQNMANQAQTGDFMQDFGAVGAHTRPFPCGQDKSKTTALGRRMRHKTSLK